MFLLAFQVGIKALLFQRSRQVLRFLYARFSSPRSFVCLFVSTRVLKAVRDYLVEGATDGKTPGRLN